MSVDVRPPPPTPSEASEQRWRALVDKTLAGAPFEGRLTREIDDDLRSSPLYTLKDAPPPLPDRLRGPAARRDDAPWDLRVEVGASDPAAANALALEGLEGGASSLLLRLAGPGREGVRVEGEADLARVLAGVHLDLAPVALDAGAQGVAAAARLVAVAEARTLRPRLLLHMDPVSAGAAAIGGAAAPEADVLLEEIAQAAQAARGLRADSAFLASGRFVHEAGGGGALELGVLCASLIAYLKALTAAGDTPGEALARITLALSVDHDYFLGLAKVRAARRLFDAVARGLGVEAPSPARIEARSSGRMLSALDPNVNMLRLTAACFAAGAGGADAVILDPFDAPTGATTPLSRRQARNAQLVLMFEGAIADVRDPAGGSYYVERLAEELAAGAWAKMQAIEGQGGVAAVLCGGALAAEVGASRSRRLQRTASRAAGLVGVTDFPNLDDPAPPGAGVPSDHGRLTPVRLSAAVESLRARAAAMSPPPRAYLALLGGARDHGARAAFASNALAVGGVAASQGPPEAFVPDGDAVAVLCGSEEVYASAGAPALATLRALGARHILIAGRGPAALTAAGVDGALTAGMDHVQVLGALLDVYAGARR